MIFATVGHVDHGKSTLVHALTGVDTDRLPEEKARGLSIDLGFAYRSTASGARLGFVDVPGHQRFVRTMMAGVAGIDHALVVVAADDGPMPQTREHLAILDLLGVCDVTVVITKIDRVEVERVHAVEAQIRPLLPTGATKAQAFHVSALRGDGIDALAAHLDTLANAWVAPVPSGNFRMSIDRGFTLPGAGLVVTGTVLAGALEVNEYVTIMPGAHRARARRLQAGHVSASRVGKGERCALNLSGSEMSAEAVHRGGWIVAKELAQATRSLDLRVRWLPDAAALQKEARVHLHLGAGEFAARMTPIGAPLGDGCLLATVTTEEPVAALWGDRCVIRDWSAKHTLGGGRVLDPFPPARGRHTAARRAQLEALTIENARDALEALLGCQPEGVDLARFALARNLTDMEAEAAFQGLDMVRAGPERDAVAVAGALWRALGKRTKDALDEWHRAHPGYWGPGEAQLRACLDPRPGTALFGARLRSLVADGAISRRGNRVHRIDYKPTLNEAQRALWAQIESLLLAGGVRAAPLSELTHPLDMTLKDVQAAIAQFADLGFLQAVCCNRYYLPQTIEQLAREAQALCAARDDAMFSAAEYRDRIGIGRNLTIQILEYFDRCGLTRRVGERRRLIRAPEQVFGKGAC